MKISHTEENYLKAIFSITEKGQQTASTNAISHQMKTSAASVTDMVKRLAKKELVIHERHKGVKLTDDGNTVATKLIRKHRLWEVFLVEKLNFLWDEVHDIAEELEHIQSDDLVQRLDQFLGFPKFDPHGDPIPDEDGNFAIRQQKMLSEIEINQEGIIVGVGEHSTPFLQYLGQIGIALGSTIKVLEKFEFDESVKILLNNKKELTVTHKVALNLFLQKNNS